MKYFNSPQRALVKHQVQVEMLLPLRCNMLNAVGTTPNYAHTTPAQFAIFITQLTHQ